MLNRGTGHGTAREIASGSLHDGEQVVAIKIQNRASELQGRGLKFDYAWNQARREHAQSYDRLLSAAGLTKTGANSPAPVTPLKTRPEAHHIFHQYVIRAQQRDQLREFLKERGVGSEIYDPVPLHLQKCFAYLGYAEGDCPEAERAAADVLALPMFAELEQDEQRCVVDTIAEFYS